MKANNLLDQLAQTQDFFSYTKLPVEVVGPMRDTTDTELTWAYIVGEDHLVYPYI